MTSACAPVSEAAVGGSTPFDIGTSAAAGTADSERTLVFGYGAIAERYLDRTSVAAVATNGIDGLANLDDSIEMRHAGDTVTVSVDRRVVGRFVKPDEHDAAGWARLTLEVAVAVRGASAKMRQVDDDRLLKTVFETTLAKLDPFSRYSTPGEARGQRANRNGFAGIGVRYDKVGAQGVEISSVIPESPAGDAGIRDGDILTHIDGTPVSALPIDRVSEMLRGEIGSPVTLTVLRRDGGTTERLALRRSMVIPPTVAMTLEHGVANIKITGFNQRTAAHLAKNLREARGTLGSRLKGVLLDLRGNPGGLLDQAVAMADMFMANGRIVSTQGRHRHASQIYDASPGDIAEDLPLVLLVDGKSASASEILAAALQDAGRAVVIGTNSYGKGTVQTVIRLPNDGEMTLTWSRFHSPTGYPLHGLGVLPSICTSAGGKKVADLVAALALPDPAVANQLALWRSTGIDQTDLRNQLRATCPSEKHADHPEDSRLAGALFADKALYVRALALSSPTTGRSGSGAWMVGGGATTQAEVDTR